MPSLKPTILVVDDEAINIQVIGEILGGEYEVIFALQGQDALRMARQSVPDLVLLDVKMPGMDGYEVCSRLLEDPRTAAIAVMFVTALDSTAQEVKGLEAGAIDYITKPLMPEIVRARVRNHLALRRRIDQSASQGGVRAEGLAPEISVRQRQILEWIQAGKTNGEIATIIGSSKANVKYHIARIMAALNTHNRTQLIAKATSLRLIHLKH